MWYGCLVVNNICIAFADIRSAIRGNKDQTAMETDDSHFKHEIENLSPNEGKNNNNHHVFFKYFILFRNETKLVFYRFNYTDIFSWGCCYMHLF